MKVEKLLKIARQTRKWAMANRHKGHFDRTLSCMCGIAAMRLFENLVKNGIKAKLAVRSKRDEGHCFVVVNNLVLDVTASQFGQAPVFMKTVAEAQQLKAHGVHYWRPTALHDSVESLLAYLKKHKWPLDQMYLGYEYDYDIQESS